VLARSMPWSARTAVALGPARPPDFYEKGLFCRPILNRFAGSCGLDCAERRRGYLIATGVRGHQFRCRLENGFMIGRRLNVLTSILRRSNHLVSSSDNRCRSRWSFRRFWPLLHAIAERAQ